MQLYEKDFRYITIFESVEEITACTLEATEKHRQHKQRALAWQAWSPRATIGREEFVGREFCSWSDVERAANSTWAEGLAITRAMLAELADDALPMPVSRRRAPAYREDDGDEICMDRLRAGQAYWRGTLRQRRTGPTSLTVVIDMATSGVVDTDQILWRGVAAIVLAERLEAAGYMVEIWLASHTTNCHLNGLGSLIACRLKDAGAPLDIASLVNAVSGWFYRTVVFGSHSLPASPPGSSLGTVQRIGAAERTEFLAQPDEAVVVTQVWDRYAALDWIKTQLARFAEQFA
jgi:hypothetical protein